MTSPVPKQRIIAIVGRPNVGKSALFNRIVGHRVSIVHAESGVTRDRLIHQASWNSQPFQLIDTGGLCNVDSSQAANAIEHGIRRQIEAALQDAAAAILVVDVRAGLHPMDLEVARLLRSQGCFTVVACNKADAKPDDERTPDFASLGFDLFPISALHNRGLAPMMKKVMTALPPPSRETMTEEGTPLRVAILGRPNVGKSSYINALLRSDRVIVSPVAGTTHDCVDVPFTVTTDAGTRRYILMDTPGLRQAGKIHNAVERFGGIRAEESIARCDVAVLLMDAEQGPTSFEKRIAALIREHKKSCVLIVNKWDLAKDGSQKEYAEALMRVMTFMDYCPLCFVSSKSLYNIQRSVETIDDIAANSRIKLPTGILNRVIEDAQLRVHPHTVKGRHLRIYYGVHTGTLPHQIRFFVNDPKLVQAHYMEYLANSIRTRFELEGCYLELQFVPRSRKNDKK